MSTPLISVVVPSYNQGEWIEQTLRSLLLQGDPNLEVIVMDGGSTDRTREVLERFRPQLAHCVSERDNGQADAIAKGFRLARGEILAWLNSDDLHMPWTLKTVRRVFAASPQLELVHGGRAVIDENGRVADYRLLPFHSAYLLNRWPWTAQETCFWRRSLMERCGPVDPAMRFAMDYELFARFFQQGNCRFLRTILGAFRWHSTSKSYTQLATIGREEIAEVRRRYGVMPKRWERPIEIGLTLSIRLLGRLHQALPHRLPGRPTILNCNVDDFWGGRLRGTPAACASSN
ncbi:MAG: glycosyltransferase family 2 protein [Phycisphaerales bacterium]